MSYTSTVKDYVTGHTIKSKVILKGQSHEKVGEMRSEYESQGLTTNIY
jgi:hypothetical protein